MRRRLMSGKTDIKATLIQQIDTQAGDIVFTNPNSDSKVYYRLDDGNDVIPKSFVPIGVVVIPALHDVYGTGACGVMSLRLMSTIHPEEGTLLWREDESWVFGIGYDNKADICYIGKDGIINKEVQGTITQYFCSLPSDAIEGIQNTYDTKTYYSNDAEYYAPSPYNEDDSRNPAYYQITSPSSINNALAYFNGQDNTKAVLAENNYDTVAEACCNKFKTQGTNSGDWYLPSIAELGYLVPRFNIITTAVNKLNEYYEDIISFQDMESYDSLGITSTSLDSYLYDISCYGEIRNLPKDWGGIAFAFTQIGTLDKNYGDIYISGGNVTDIPASGGESQVTGYTYSQTYGYGDSTTNGGTITSGADIEVASVSADSLGTTEKERTKIGESIITVTMNGKSAIASYEVYQEANVKTATGTSGGDITYGNVTAGSITNGWVGAGGGTGTGYADNGSQSWSKSAITTYYSYTSGATSSAITTAASSGTNSIAPSRSSYSVSPGSRGTTVGDVLTWSAGVTWSGNAGKSASGTIYVQQAANQVTGTSWYNGSPGVWANKTVNSKSSNVTVVSGTGISKNRLVLSILKKNIGSASVTIQGVFTQTYSSGASATINASPYSVDFDNGNGTEIGTTISGTYPNFNLSFSDCSSYNRSNSSILKIGLSLGSQLYQYTTIEIKRPSY